MFNLCVHMEQHIWLWVEFWRFRFVFRPGFHFGAPKKHKVMTKSILDNIYWKILFQKVALGYLLHFVQNGSSKNILKTYLVHINLKNPKVTRPGFHLGAPKKRKVATKTISYRRYGGILFPNKRKLATQTTSYRRYGGILFQKVASGYLLHFVQDGT